MKKPFALLLLAIPVVSSCSKDKKTDPTPVDPLMEGLIAYYPLNGNGLDKSGNSYDLTIAGPTVTADRFGKADAAYSFNGTTDYMIIPGLLKADSLRQFSISLWIKPSSISYNTFISLRSVVSNLCTTSMSFEYYGAQTIIRNKVIEKDIANECSVAIFKDTINKAPNNWQHFVLVQTYRTGPGVIVPYYVYELFHNGNSVAIGNSTLGVSPKPISLKNGGLLGGNNNSGNINANFELFNGDIDEVKIYNRAISAAEATELYNLK